MMGKSTGKSKGDTLTLSAVKGTNGRMKEDDSDAPWFEYGKQIKNIVIQDGVTSLGAWAFVTCYQVEQVIIPKSVKKNISIYIYPNVRRNIFEKCLWIYGKFR